RHLSDGFLPVSLADTLKSAVFGGIIAIVACYKGLGAKQGAEGVGIATTGSVVLSIVLIFITNYFLSILLYV
ncbi:ABC transporter permease, partial [Phascolarctobacterium faecium]|uniref:ABC transporter permease n=1 Tax=Phascolarctobacterium faecium TaxID=33025 RepID=UPI0030785EF7